MKIVLCGSVQFAGEFQGVARKLSLMGYEVLLPDRLTEESSAGRDDDEAAKRKMEFDLIRAHWDKIMIADAILVLNFDKGRTRSYIGGNSFLELGFAHVLGKKIFLLNSVPQMSYTAEIKAMQPIALEGRLNRIEI